MMPRHRLLPRLLMLIAPVLLLTSCASKSPNYNVVPEIPPLPDEARVSKVPIPSVCLPTCMSVVQRTLSSEADTLTHFGGPD